MQRVRIILLVLIGAELVQGQIQTGGLTSSSGSAINFSSSGHTTPEIVVANVGALPATCTTGETAFVTAATAGKQGYKCSSTNTWTQDTGVTSGLGTCSLMAAGANTVSVDNGSGCPIDSTVTISSGAVSAPGSVSSGVGSGVAGAYVEAAGTLPSVVANSVMTVAPTSVTGYQVVWPGAAVTGFPFWTNASNVVTETVVATVPVANGGTNLTSGTSGGILGYTASGVLASSGALTANLPVIGGGAGATPTVGTVTGNTTQFATWTGATTASRCVDTDASGNLHITAADCGSGGGAAGNSITSSTPVTVNANSTSDQTLMELSLSAGYLNSSGQPFLINAAGLYTTPVGQTPTLTFKAKLCTVSGCGSGTVVTLASIVTTATVASSTNNNWNLSFLAYNHATGSSGTLEVHGPLSIDLGALTTTADSIFNDVNTVVSGTIDLTAALFVDFTVATSTGSASNSITQRSGGVMPFAATAAPVTSVYGLTGAVSPTAHNQATPLLCAPASASGTAYTCTTSPTFTPVAGDTIIFQPDVANTNSATLNVNSSSAATIKKQQGQANLVANDLRASPAQTLLTYDGTNWEQDGQTGNAAASSGVGTLWTVNTGGAAISASTTTYGFVTWNTSFSTAANRAFTVAAACTASNLRMRTSNSQNAGGSLVITLYDVDGAAGTALTATVAAGDPAEWVRDTTHTVSLVVEHHYAIQFVNNYSGGNSANINDYALECN